MPHPMDQNCLKTGQTRPKSDQFHQSWREISSDPPNQLSVARAVRQHSLPLPLKEHSNSNVKKILTTNILPDYPQWREHIAQTSHICHIERGGRTEDEPDGRPAAQKNSRTEDKPDGRQAGRKMSWTEDELLVPTYHSVTMSSLSYTVQLYMYSFT